MQRFFILAIVSLAAMNIASTSSNAIDFQAVFLTQARIDTIKQRIAENEEPAFTAFQALKKSAEGQLNRKPHAPEHWYVPGFYNDAEGHTNAKRGLQDDANAAYELALYYCITGEERYAVSSVRLIDAWATNLKTASDKDDSTLSFSYHFPALIFAADLLRDYPGWPQASQQRFKDFVRDRAIPLNTMDRKNNWGNWGLVLVLASAAYLRDEALMDTCIARWKEFIEIQIAEDGHLPHEVHRSEGMRGIWYSHFTLMPQTIAAEIIRVNGVDLFEYESPGGRTLRQAFERIAPWTHHPETFPYYKDDPQKLTGTTYVSYFEILNTHWPNPDATAMLESLRPLTARHSAPALTLTHGELINNKNLNKTKNR